MHTFSMRPLCGFPQGLLRPSATGRASAQGLGLRGLIAAVGMSFSGLAFAGACTSTTNLGGLNAPFTIPLGNAFGKGADFSDCWQFSVAALSKVSGTTTETIADAWFLPRHIDVLSVSLWDLGTDTQVGATDLTPELFEFNSLAAGSYRLVLEGYATQGFGVASYAGTLKADQGGTVPEPSPAALLGLALGAAGWASRAGRARRV
jgi:hypothetical protein